MKVTALKQGDLVSDSDGTLLGEVISFHVDGVRVRWDNGETHRYSDEDLKARGVALVEGAR